MTIAERFQNAVASLQGKTIDPSGKVADLTKQLGVANDAIKADAQQITDLGGQVTSVTAQLASATDTLAAIGPVDVLTAALTSLETLAGEAGA